jgi:hypothetical protein
MAGSSLVNEDAHVLVGRRDEPDVGDFVLRPAHGSGFFDRAEQLRLCLGRQLRHLIEKE